MKKQACVFLVAIGTLFAAFVLAVGADDKVKLPLPEKKGKVSLEETINNRRSIRSFSEKVLSIKQIGQLLWAAQGITDDKRGFRTAPSAGALYPLKVFSVTSEGVHEYLPKEHSLKATRKGDVRTDLLKAAFGQPWVKNAPLVIVIAADYSITTGKYKSRGRMYVHIEAGHVAQNIHLQAVALGLGSVPVGAVHEDGVTKALSLPSNLTPLYLICVGYEK